VSTQAADAPKISMQVSGSLTLGMVSGLVQALLHAWPRRRHALPHALHVILVK
jgi:hypothetical protein